nr:MAG TPA: hypothetical protein [Caudoviricetes sp.]
MGQKSGHLGQCIRCSIQFDIIIFITIIALKCSKYKGLGLFHQKCFVRFHVRFLTRNLVRFLYQRLEIRY